MLATILSILALIISTPIALYALKVSMESRTYTRKQVELMQKQEEEQRRDRATEEEWAAKFDAAVSAVLKTAPTWTKTPEAQVPTFALTFPDQVLIGRIERYLIEGSLHLRPVVARQIQATELRLPIVRETITQVLECVEKFKRDWPDEAARLKL